MSKSSSGWSMNSLPLKFLFLPFKFIYTLFLIVLIIFGSSLLTQGYFNSDSLLRQEIQELDYLANTGVNDDMPINLSVAEYTYKTLHSVFFDLTHISSAMHEKDENTLGYKVRNYLTPRMAYVQHFDNTLKVIAIRIGNICFFIGLNILLYLIALVDGFVMRKIRQGNASRESAGIYHRGKYWRIGVTWLSILIYLCSPIVINPLWLVIPIGIIAYMVFLQVKYLKKYL